jgi:hypothetical protein
MFQRQASISRDEGEDLVDQIVKSRQFCLVEFGLDVSLLCHQLLALAARWHAMASRNDNSSKVSPLLSALAQHEDLDVDRCDTILKRLVMPAPTDIANDHAVAFFSDGYGVERELPDLEKNANDETRRRRHRNKQDQMAHEEIERMLGSHEIIEDFIRDLRLSTDMQKAQEDAKSVESSSIEDSQRSLMLQEGEFLDEEEYGERLSDWVVSSSSFANPHKNTTYIHHYDGTARSRGAASSGKSLVKEARRCHKMLPTPHANSSCFVCFAEERMDLCRAIVTGPVR